MDQNSNPSDTRAADSSRDAEEFAHRPPMPWDQMLAVIRQIPQLSAVEAARTASQMPGVAADALSPLQAAGTPPTWDGLHTVINTLLRMHLLPAQLPQTRSPTAMLTHLLTELALSVSDHRSPPHDLASASKKQNTVPAQVRFETECITWLIAGRLGVRAVASGSLKGYLKHGDLIPEFSRDRVLQTVDTIEDLFGGALAFGTTIREETPSLFELEVGLAV
ncbi:hypothetical protein SAMN04489752_2688 [Brevibacterium siliguriense]|uniref:Uncharacterized protein n=1 Tax=Brevibacterium siliguriense TaxID=1136497 RepID=A0A1H1VL88_9MICO|nr:hypothetical protein [Brevibacterium siliguriense]SDS85445.1 hypothetical protein SAMN04489752_2688 [Brevibacterium siliguriense]